MNKFYVGVFFIGLILVLGVGLGHNFFVEDVEYVEQKQSYLTTPYLANPNNMNKLYNDELEIVTKIT